ncbi:MAG: SDR family oxidoreductase [Chitinophagales bacterium]|nr:SDR family oxidoreductase [Bacteroidota bacterium]MBP7400208.1 SDR family oxidoreductase [Chitinophagales bacterium]MBK8487949.1 SDR family oxidoreductase [Bacteroidota bacterium]MBP8754275.1 SDR family oxidoreductase [Chitinophagales bacterium]MBP9188142.1 SDR family oxidoreductase [Chitinophagales bacterium]
MNVLVTGGAGYIGTTLIQKLCASELVSTIIIYDNLSRNNETVLFGSLDHPEKIRLIRADILDSRKLRQSLKNIEVVFHLAAKVLTPFANQDPHFFEQINHWGTAELVYAIEESNVQKCIYVSSTSVYGRTDAIVTEQSPTHPKTYYGISKKRGEEHIERLFKKMNTIIIRCGNVYGINNGIRFDAVINNFMLQANFENRISIHGSGLQERSFIHVNDIGETLTQLVKTKVPSGIYNRVTKTLSVNEIADEIELLYPGLERIFINQHMEMGSLVVSSDSALNRFIPTESRSLAEELKEFKSHFAFGGSVH